MLRSFGFYFLFVLFLIAVVLFAFGIGELFTLLASGYSGMD
jgi:hypothetical protein